MCTLKDLALWDFISLLMNAFLNSRYLPSDMLMSGQICLFNQIMTAFMSAPWQLNENNSERALSSLVNINLFLFILTLSPSSPPKKPCLLHIPIHSSLSMRESPLSTPQRRRPVVLVQSEGWMKPKPRLTSHACCIGFQFAIEQSRDNKTCTGLWVGTKKRWKKMNGIAFSRIHYTPQWKCTVCQILVSSSDVVGMIFTFLYSQETVSTQQFAQFSGVPLC